MSDNDDNLEGSSMESMANRKRKLIAIGRTNKRMHIEQLSKTGIDFDSDSNHGNTDRAKGFNDNDDGSSSRMSDYDDGILCKIFQENYFI